MEIMENNGKRNGIINQKINTKDIHAHPIAQREFNQKHGD
jgi:hypothetical protein